MKPLHAPIYEALSKHAKSDPASFHVPGHQNGRVWKEIVLPQDSNEEIKKTFAPIMAMDVTELSSTDDLHHPEAAIQEAQSLAALSFGADSTYFLVGGSTSGNLAMLLAVCDPGDFIIAQRNVHKSVINGFRLAGANVIFVTPQSAEESGLAVIPSVAQIKEALQRYPHAKAVFLSNPNYYGIGAELSPYAEAAHRYGIPLLVDEAHGAHYGQHSELPRSAMQAGADAAVQSTHKTLPALTMGAMLHVHGNLINKERLKQALAIVQSSSPSFPIMASLDISRAMMDSMGERMFQHALDLAREFREWLDHNNLLLIESKTSADKRILLRIDEAEANHIRGSYQRDPLRLVIYDRTGRLSGRELQKLLEGEGCWAEMSDSKYVVLLIGIGTGQEHMDRLKAAIRMIHVIIASHLDDESKMDTDRMTHAAYAGIGDRESEIGEPVSFSGGWYKDHPAVRLPLKEAVGRRAAEMVVPYPPGIPLLYAGERITSEMTEALRRLAASGANFQGASDPRMDTIAVYEERK